MVRAMNKPRPESWIQVTPRGLYVAPGDFYVDPVRPVERAVVTQGHAGDAGAGDARVVATREPLAIVAARYGAAAGAGQALAYGEAIAVGGVTVRLAPAGHVLGSAQAVLEWGG